MLGKLFVLFTLVPALELYLLVQIGERFGAALTFALLLGTGALGAALARAEGLRVLRDWQMSLAAGEVPADGVVSSALVLLGGVLLITPGVLTDCVGLLLLVPAVRRPVAGMWMRRLERAVASGRIHVVQTYRWPSRPSSEVDADEVITVEGETVSERRGREALPEARAANSGKHGR